MPRPVARALIATVALCVLPFVSGCTALVAKSRLLGAETALAAAKRAGAEQKAVYEYTSAVLYLEKAREQESYSRFGPAFDYGALSEKFAEQAKLKAMAADAEPPPSPAVTR